MVFGPKIQNTFGNVLEHMRQPMRKPWLRSFYYNRHNSTSPSEHHCRKTRFAASGHGFHKILKGACRQTYVVVHALWQNIHKTRCNAHSKMLNHLHQQVTMQMGIPRRSGSKPVLCGAPKERDCTTIRRWKNVILNPVNIYKNGTMCGCFAAFWYK